MIKIREYVEDDLNDILDLFYNTVHFINCFDYTKEQLEAWAPLTLDKEKWRKSFINNHVLVALSEEKIVGFGDITKDGYLDRLYVDKDYQRLGIASKLCDMLEASFKTIEVAASITAKSFFEKRGYEVINKQVVIRNNIELVNFKMKKTLVYSEPHKLD